MGEEEAMSEAAEEAEAAAVADAARADEAARLLGPALLRKPDDGGVVSDAPSP